MLGLPEPVREYVFAPPRKWRFDFAWPEERLAAEVDGGLWGQGRHNRAAGFERDLEKLNTATLLGWRVLRFSTSMVLSGQATLQIRDALRAD